MRLLTSPLRRIMLGLQNLYEGEGGSPPKCCVLNPHRLLRRQNFSAKVTATELVSYWRGVFEANGIPEAQESSEYIVSYILGAKTFHSLGAGSLSTPLTLVQREQIQQLGMKRLQRMPVQYVLGEWDFRELTLKMRPPVFIPRPETETSPLHHWTKGKTPVSPDALLAPPHNQRLLCWDKMAQDLKDAPSEGESALEFSPMKKGT